MVYSNQWFCYNDDEDTDQIVRMRKTDHASAAYICPEDTFLQVAVHNTPFYVSQRKQMDANALIGELHSRHMSGQVSILL